jgi:hypothetical protein
MKNMNTAAVPNSGSEFNKAETRRLMLGKALILLRGLITLRILNAFKFIFTLKRSIILTT